MKNDNIVYVVSIDNIDNDYTTLSMKTFDSYLKAKQHLLALKQEFENECLSSYETDDYVIEEDDYNYVWYEKGNYNNNHYCITINQQIIY